MQKGFEEFWKAYPKKRAKARAVKAWMKNVGHDAAPAVLKALAVHRRRRDWHKEEGRFIPLPATWLNDHAWEDEFPAADLIPTPQEFRRGQDLAKMDYKRDVERSWQGVEDPAAWLRRVKEENMSLMRGKPNDDRITEESCEVPFDAKGDEEIPF